jgi:hypothetical protein
MNHPLYEQIEITGVEQDQEDCESLCLGFTGLVLKSEPTNGNYYN